MFRTVTISAGLQLAGALLWAGRLIFGASPWEPQPASLLAVSLVIAGAVNLVAMLLSPGRWVRNSMAVLAGSWAPVALVLAVDPLWIGGFLTYGGGVGIAWSRPLDPWFHQTRPDRVPPRATMLALGLVWLPGFVGAFGIPGVTPTGWAMAGFALAAGWAYARTLPGSLWAIRLLLPLLGISAATGLRLLPGAGLLAVTSTLTLLAWTADARLATRRPVPRRVSSVSVHPELTPPGLVEAAGYDRRGQLLREQE